MDIKINQHQFKSKRNGTYKLNYNQGVSIGKGAHGEVIQVNDHNGIKKAMKKFPKSEDGAINEIKLLQQLDHPNILKLYEFFEDATHYFIITEYWQGGDLYEYMMKEHTFTQDDIAEIMKQLLSILNYIHSLKIVHRDIKSENILVLKSDQGVLIKLIDWGIATQFKDNTMMNKQVGTAYYMAPEVFKGCYDYKCDLWSAGILLFEMVTGQLPFYARYDHEVGRLVKDTAVNYDEAEWSCVNTELLDLTKKLLQKDAAKRVTAAEALQHPFFHLPRVRSKSQELTNSLYDSVRRLKEFRAHTKLQQAVLSYISLNIEQNDQIFNELDTNSDGKLTTDELTKALGMLFNESGPEADLTALAIMNNLDIDGSGCLDYSEFVMACSNKQSILSENSLKQAFQQFDLNSDGVISLSELKTVLCQDNDSIDNNKWEEIIHEVDTDGDGAINYSEFIIMMSQLK